MAGMIQTGLGPSTEAKYKEEPLGDDHLQRVIPIRQSPRSFGYAQQQNQHPSSPFRPSVSLPSDTFASGHPLGNSAVQHQVPYHESTQDVSYYTSHHTSYTVANAPGRYSSSGPPNPMASTARMHRPFPSIYNTSQPNSPGSVGSHGHDQHGRNIYTQSPQMAPQLYGYQSYSSMNPVQQPSYAPHASPSPHHLAVQPLMMPPHSNAPHTQPQVQVSSSGITTSLSVTSQLPPLLQRAALTLPQPGINEAASTDSNVHGLTSNTSTNAAPGPIPATTPLVVRQDGNGVQWIAFEYSRDRVKMEYTIRCDVESVSVDNLSPEFKAENCVYPRACCSKDQYRGNRLVYETECNAVGWALADLNPALRGKRGLIQRAVDSWRNSNQDPRLRSRRVRRIAKINRRQTIPAQPPPHMGVAGPMASGLSNVAMAAPGVHTGQSQLGMAQPQLHHHHHHHHHAQPEGSVNSIEASGNDQYSNDTSQPGYANCLPEPIQSGADIRSGQVFHGYIMHPISAGGQSSGSSMPPPVRGDAIGGLDQYSTVAITSDRDDESGDDECHPSNEELFGTQPDGKRRKFILVDDQQRGCRVRVKVTLDQVNMNEIPDSYRMSNSVYPRTYFPVQMKVPSRQITAGRRYFKGDQENDDSNDDAESATFGRVVVSAPQIDGEIDIVVPRLTRAKRRREVFLNELGYRMSWSQRRAFAGRPLFLQRSLDAYRNKTYNTMLAAGQDPASIPAHLETRPGKRRFLEREKRRSGRMGAMPVARRSAEEIEP